MVLKRKIEQQMREWKNSPYKRPLIIKGPRQCGKTYSVLKFAHENYKHVVYLNFFESPKYTQAFAGALTMDEIMLRLIPLMEKRVAFVPHETVLVFDEIQDCPEARTALKFICIDGRFDVICTGSLLGVKGYGKEPRSIPVGYENYLYMKPLDFEEFLWAMDIPDVVIDHIKQKCMEEQPIDQAIHSSLRDHFLRYTIVGGMPMAVQAFKETKDIRLVQKIQREIVTAYKADMVKYASSEDRAHIKECFESIPSQLGKENKKFQYSVVRKGGKASTYAGSLQWIEDAGIISRCYNVSLPEFPLEGVRIPEMFKVYMNDPGLFLSMLSRDSAAEVLQGNLGIYKGAVYENLMAGILNKLGRKLYYYHKDGGIELDFLIEDKGMCLPIEVKATTGNAKSLKTVFKYPEKYHITEALKFGDYNVGRSGSILTLPLYVAGLFINAEE